ncbi:MAG: tetratricopeptide repeat protein [Bacteroidales bacterium]|nr:tetratricopeptide repeat protein [Bacteroidales bacterium]
MQKFILLLSAMFLFILPIAAENERRDADTATAMERIRQHNEEGKSHYHKGEFTDAMISFLEALNLAESINDSAFMAKLHSNIGVINDMVGNYAEALMHYQKSLLIYDKQNNIKGKESVLNNMGVVYEELNMPEKSLENYFLALQIKRQKGDKKSIAGTYNNIAILYENFLDDTDSAYYYYKEALAYYTEVADEQGIALISSNLGIIHLRKGEVERARQYIDQALEIFTRMGNTAEVASALYFQGKICQAENIDEKALDYFLKACNLAEQHNIKKLLSRVYLDLAQTYRKQNNYKEAIAVYEKYMEIKDQLLDMEKMKQIQGLEMSFNVAKKEQEIALLKNKASMKSIELLWAKRMLFALLLILILGITIAILNRHKNLLKKKQELLLLQSRLFRSQTAPHFIFNSLMSIQTFLLEKKVEEALEYLVDFARLIRSILQNTRKSFIPLDKEIETLKQYVNLEKLRFSDKFDVDFQVHVSEPEEILVPPMLAQPFIENAVRHGLLPAEKKGLLKIYVSEADNMLVLLIEDNGIGRQQAALKKKNKAHKSMAIEITNERVRVMTKRFKKRISFQIEDLTDAQGRAAGTRVVFKMSLK